MKEPWQPLATTIAGFMKFGDQHPNKPLVLPEFGSAEGGPGAKGAWLDEARALFKTAPYADRFAAVSYFHNDDEMTPACNWWLDSSTAALKSAQGLAQDAYFRNTAAAS